MKTFPTVEDYIEVISGIKDPVTNNISHSWLGFDFKPIINLARYDVSVLENMSESVANGKALTERQGDLATKIILKYQRQLAQKLIDVTPVEHPVWRMPLRKMDYTQSLSIKQDKLAIKFPYNQKLIESIRSFRTNSQGFCVFDSAQKEWTLALTEYNLNWCYAWAQEHQFLITDEVVKLFNLITESEKIPYKIELVYNNNRLDILNCPDSLREYIENNLGGFDHDNLLKLIDYSAELGYTINDDLADCIVKQWGPRFFNIATNRELKINPSSVTAVSDIETILNYAETVGKFPLVVFEPDLSGRILQQIKTVANENEIIEVKNGKTPQVLPTTKFIYTIKPLKTLNYIPMLISSAGMMFGGDKELMLQRSGKIVYLAAEIYNKNSSPKAVKIAS